MRYLSLLIAAMLIPIAAAGGWALHRSDQPTVSFNQALAANGLKLSGAPAVDYWYVKGDKYAEAAAVILGAAPKVPGGHFVRQTCFAYWDVKPPQGKVWISVCRFKRTTPVKIIQELKEESDGASPPA